MRVPRRVAFLLACACVAVSSGGLILGWGPLAARLVQDGYIHQEQAGLIFTGAFQIMTWGSVLAVHLENCVGPRMSAAFGACLMLPGHMVLANLPVPADPYVILIAYGLLGWGGNHVYLTSIHFARLFPERLALADGILAGLYNTAGLVFVAFNVQGLGVREVFSTLACVCVGAVLLISFLWPDRAYESGESASLSWPTLRHVKSPCKSMAYGSFVRHFVSARYALYVLTFAWTTLISAYVMGNLGACYDVSLVGDSYSTLAFPLIVNPICVFGWLVGWAIDATGFAWVSLALLLLCIFSVWCLWAAQSAVAAWTNLVLLNWIQALQYTIQFAFLHKALPEEAFAPGLVGALGVQGLLGFVNAPGLNPNPWGSNRDPAFLVLVLPTLLLLTWPVLEYRLHSTSTASILSFHSASGVSIRSSIAAEV